MTERRLMHGEAAEPAEAGAVLKRFCQMHIRQVVPGGEQQGTEQSQRRPPLLPLGRSRDAREQRVQLDPVHQSCNFVQRGYAGLRRPLAPKLLLSDTTPCHDPLRHAYRQIESQQAAPVQATRVQVSLLARLSRPNATTLPAAPRPRLPLRTPPK